MMLVFGESVRPSNNGQNLSTVSIFEFESWLGPSIQLYIIVYEYIMTNIDLSNSPTQVC